jgi:hypothetical protein
MPPTAVTASPGLAYGALGPLTVSFTPGFNNGSAATGYSITCVSSDGGVTRTLPTGAASTSVGLLTTGKTYTCSVTATNDRGMSIASTPSDPIVVGVPAKPYADATPGVVGATTGQLIVQIAPGSNNGSAITSYAATCVSKNGGVTRSATSTTMQVTVSALTTGKTYTCTATATNARGTSFASTPSPVGVVVSGPPAAPTDPIAVKIANGSLRVSFVAPAANGSAITSYTVKCVTLVGTTVSVSGPSGPITVTGLTHGRSYRCTVTATNARGTSAASSPSAAVTP